jgi:hypothetical protein
MCAAVSLYNPSTGCAVDATTTLQIPSPSGGFGIGFDRLPSPAYFLCRWIEVYFLCEDVPAIICSMAL